MKSLLSLMAGVTVVANVLPIDVAAADIIKHWGDEYRDSYISNATYIPEIFDDYIFLKNKHEINIIFIKNKIYVNDERFPMEFIGRINSNPVLLNKFLDSPNVVMKKQGFFINYPINIVKMDINKEGCIMPSNPIIIEEGKIIADYSINVSSTTKCCATGTCDNITINPGDNDFCTSCHPRR